MDATRLQTWSAHLVVVHSASAPVARVLHDLKCMGCAPASHADTAGQLLDAALEAPLLEHNSTGTERHQHVLEPKRECD